MEAFDEKNVVDETEDEVIPFRYAITSYGADYPVDGLVKRMKEGSVFVPPFQRSFIWPHRTASRFIESLLLGLPVPGIFLSKEPDSGKLLIIDGQQRLRSLQCFYEGIFKGREFKLKGVQEKYDGLGYADLDPDDRIRLDDSIIHATIVKQDEPSEDQSSVFHIFERINTGGTQLQAQEIRACILHGRFNEFLAELNENPSWREIFGKPSLRLKDQELILRFLALHERWEAYERPIKEFLTSFMAAHRNSSEETEKRFKSLFEGTVTSLHEAVGDPLFRPERAINAAVFDSVMLGLAKRLSQESKPLAEEIKRAYEQLLSNDEFIQACKTGTSDAANVQKRIGMAISEFGSI